MAWMSLGDAWKQAFSDRVGEVHPQYKQQCKNTKVLDDSAPSFKKYELGSTKNLGAGATFASAVEHRLDSRRAGCCSCRSKKISMEQTLRRSSK